MRLNLRSLLDAIDSSAGQSGKAASDLEPRATKVVVYFDEAHALTRTDAVMGGDPDGWTLYYALCSAISCLTAQPIMFLFLSTIPNITTPAPPTTMATSARARRVIMHAPITEVPFDCSPDLPLLPGAHSLGELSTQKFMANFGRPL